MLVYEKLTLQNQQVTTQHPQKGIYLGAILMKRKSKTAPLRKKI